MKTSSSDPLASLSRLWLVAWLVLGACFLFGWVPQIWTLGSAVTSPPVTLASSDSHSSVPQFRPIEEIRVGDRVATDVPDEVWETDFLEPEESPTVVGPDLDPASWRLIRMHGETRLQGEVIDDHQVETLQHVLWIQQNHVEVGSPCPAPLDLEEMDSDPNLQLVATDILPCPPIKRGKGRLVLTTVNHFNTDSYRLVVADALGREETIEPTGKHRFYSATQKTAVATEALEIGETLLGSASPVTSAHPTCSILPSPVTVISLTRSPGKHRVYNLTVQGEHVYRVSTLGMLVHNQCDQHHGTPRQIIKEEAIKDGVSPSAIRGVRGKPNKVSVPHDEHMDAHNGGANGGQPRYNDSFKERLAHIRQQRPNGQATAQDYWDIRTQLLWEYFGIR